MQKNSAVSTPKNVFLHLFLVGTLTTCVISFITLLFQYINIWLPDPLELSNAYYVRSSSLGAIRWSSSILIVAVPVLIAVGHAINKDFLAHAEVRASLIRKWLLHLVLFVTAITMIVDVIVLIFGFYNGDLTLRFALKVVAILVVAGATLAYYHWQLRREKAPSHIPNIAAGIVAAVALVTIIGGFFIVGSPAQQRAVRFDDQRANDLQSIQWQILSYWQDKQMLPTVLADLTDSFNGYTAPVDSETGNAYTYRKDGNLSFTLCATFASASEARGGKQPMPMSEPLMLGDGGFVRGGFLWDHPAGEHCFSRTIDAQRYKKTTPVL